MCRCSTPALSRYALRTEMTGTPEADRFRDTLHRVSAGMLLAQRQVYAMPNLTPSERAERAYALIAALRVTKMGDWRPTFPFIA